MTSTFFLNSVSNGTLYYTSSAVFNVIDDNLTNNVSDSFDRWRFLANRPRTPVDEHRYVAAVTARLSIGYFGKMKQGFFLDNSTVTLLEAVKIIVRSWAAPRF